jgi:hypothetical protein
MVTKINVRGAPTAGLSPSSFDISKFKSTMTNSYNRTNQFHLLLNTPPGLLSGGSKFANINKKITFDIEKATMPGVSIVTDDIRRYGYGYFDRKPYATDFAEIDALIRSDSEGFNYSFFQSWMKLIINFDVQNSMSDFSNGLGTNAGSSIPYEVSYKKDYSTTAQFVNYNEDAAPSVVIEMRNLFPIYLGEVQYDWGDNNNIVKFPVKFTYSDWHIVDTK